MVCFVPGPVCTVGMSGALERAFRPADHREALQRVPRAELLLIPGAP